MTYCSKACQTQDWLSGGHNLACSKEYADDQEGQFQGRIWPLREPESERAAAKLESLEQNFNMIQLKLFLDNSETILSQARSLGISLCDCVVQFDLRKCPPRVTTKRYSEFLYESPQVRRGFEDTRSKENITCLYFSTIFNGELLASGRAPLILMQKFYPHEWLSKETLKKYIFNLG